MGEAARLAINADRGQLQIRQLQVFWNLSSGHVLIQFHVPISSCLDLAVVETSRWLDWSEDLYNLRLHRRLYLNIPDHLRLLINTLLRVLLDLFQQSGIRH